MRNLETVIKRLKSIKALADNSTEDLNLGYHYKPFDDRLVLIIRQEKGEESNFLSVVSGGDKIELLTEEFYCVDHVPNFLLIRQIGSVQSGSLNNLLKSPFTYSEEGRRKNMSSTCNSNNYSEELNGFIVNFNIGMDYLDLVKTLYSHSEFSW